jgi:hypothetical protein
MNLQSGRLFYSNFVIGKDRKEKEKKIGLYVIYGTNKGLGYQKDQLITNKSITVLKKKAGIDSDRRGKINLDGGFVSVPAIIFAFYQSVIR